VYDIALEIISHSDGRVDQQSLSQFIAAYQTVTPLKLGEIWPSLSCCDGPDREPAALSAQISIDRINQNLADYWAEQMTQTAENDPKS